MALSVTEKEHWKNSFERKILKALEQLKKDDPVFFKRLKTESRQNALASLGIANLEEAHNDLVEAERQIVKEKAQIRESQLAKILNCDVENLEEHRAESRRGQGHHYYSSSLEGEINDAVSARKEIEKDEILQDSDLGRRVVELEQMREDMMDAVMLATSSPAIKELFSQVCEILDQPLTPVTEGAAATPSEVHFGHHEPVVSSNGEVHGE